MTARVVDKSMTDNSSSAHITVNCSFSLGEKEVKLSTQYYNTWFSPSVVILIWTKLELQPWKKGG